MTLNTIDGVPLPILLRPLLRRASERAEEGTPLGLLALSPSLSLSRSLSPPRGGNLGALNFGPTASDCGVEQRELAEINLVSERFLGEEMALRGGGVSAVREVASSTVLASSAHAGVVNALARIPGNGTPSLGFKVGESFTKLPILPGLVFGEGALFSWGWGSNGLTKVSDSVFICLFVIFFLFAIRVIEICVWILVTISSFFQLVQHKLHR